MGLYTNFAANVLFRIHEKLKGHTTIEAFQGMERSQWLSFDDLRQLQVSRLRLFLQKIGRDVPYYRELFARLDFNPDTVASLQDLSELPLMGKPEIRANMERLKAEDAGDLQRFNTGGSTGEPLVFYLGKELGAMRSQTQIVLDEREQLMPYTSIFERDEYDFDKRYYRMIQQQQSGEVDLTDDAYDDILEQEEQ